jgi:glycosyltransferase involved in cell wall biosynthesis
MKPCLRILGTRGVPAAHGGFETFAERLALYLVARGWRVVVYGQEVGAGPMRVDTWQGVERVTIPVAAQGPAATIVFDWQATMHAARASDLCLTLGYNTAVFCALLRAARVPNVINMDGIEWARAKWGPMARIWFRLNEAAGCRLGHHLIADHPEIAAHLNSRHGCASKLSTIAYGADRVTDASQAPVRALGLEPGRYFTVVARPEPENSLLEVVQGFSRRPRGLKLLVLGHYEDAQPYHRAVKAAASQEVVFAGAIYDRDVVCALRVHGAAYVHGHQVGGTNPSLVEALGAGNAVIAHDNRFNRWVAGEGARYFHDADDIDRVLISLAQQPEALAAMREASVQRFEAGLSWSVVLGSYEPMLRQWLPRAAVTEAAGAGHAARPR